VSLFQHRRSLGEPFELSRHHRHFAADQSRQGVERAGAGESEYELAVRRAEDESDRRSLVRGRYFSTGASSSRTKPLNSRGHFPVNRATVS
jgi:hypothetical protein